MKRFFYGDLQSSNTALSDALLRSGARLLTTDAYIKNHILVNCGDTPLAIADTTRLGVTSLVKGEVWEIPEALHQQLIRIDQEAGFQTTSAVFTTIPDLMQWNGRYEHAEQRNIAQVTVGRLSQDYGCSTIQYSTEEVVREMVAAGGQPRAMTGELQVYTWLPTQRNFSTLYLRLGVDVALANQQNSADALGNVTAGNTTNYRVFVDGVWVEPVASEEEEEDEPDEEYFPDHDNDEDDE